MHFETGFYLTSCEDWTTVEDSSQWGLQADNSQFCIRGAVMGFLKIPLFRKTITRWKTGSNPLYPSSYKPHHLSPTCSTTQCQNNYLERPQSVETRTRSKKKKENYTGIILWEIY